MAYASRSLRLSERHYPAHKLRVPGIEEGGMWEFHDYLYGSQVAVITDNNSLTYILTTSKFDAMVQKCVAALSGYQFSKSTGVVRRNADDDELSRHKHPQQEKTIFPAFYANHSLDGPMDARSWESTKYYILETPPKVSSLYFAYFKRSET